MKYSGEHKRTGVANLAKVGVEGSNPFARSKFYRQITVLLDLYFWQEFHASFV
jgi:hypothetical protein